MQPSRPFSGAGSKHLLTASLAHQGHKRGQGNLRVFSRYRLTGHCHRRSARTGTTLAKPWRRTVFITIAGTKEEDGTLCNMMNSMLIGQRTGDKFRVLRFAGKVALLCCDHHAPRSAVHTPRRALVLHNRARMGSPTRSRDSDGLGTNRKVCYAWSEIMRRGWWLSTLCIRAGANIWCIPRCD